MEYLWLMGAPGIGKASLMRRIAAGDAFARERLGLSGTVALAGLGFSIPLDHERADVSPLADADADHVVIKWQFVTDYLVEALRARRPDATHRGVVLWAPLVEHLRRIRARTPGWDGNTDDIRRERARVLAMAQAHAGPAFAVVALDTASSSLAATPLDLAGQDRPERPRPSR